MSANDTVFRPEFLPDDIKLTIKSMAAWKQKYESMDVEIQELRKSKETLERELQKTQENELAEQSSVLQITKEFNKMQVSLSGMVDAKTENVKLAENIKTCEVQLQELKKKLENERQSSKALMQTTCTRIADQGNKELMTAQAEINHLREQLNSCRNQMRSTAVEYQSKLRNLENSKKDEHRQSNLEHQDKIKQLQSDLQETRSYCKELQEKSRIDTANYQKKIKELENKGCLNPFLRNNQPERTPVGAPKKKLTGGRPLPSLDFVTAEPLEANRASTDNQQEPNFGVTQAVPKKRKLFVHRQDLEED